MIRGSAFHFILINTSLLRWVSAGPVKDSGPLSRKKPQHDGRMGVKRGVLFLTCWSATWAQKELYTRRQALICFVPRGLSQGSRCKNALEAKSCSYLSPATRVPQTWSPVLPTSPSFSLIRTSCPPSRCLGLGTQILFLCQAHAYWRLVGVVCLAFRLGISSEVTVLSSYPLHSTSIRSVGTCPTQLSPVQASGPHFFSSPLICDQTPFTMHTAMQILA